MKIFKFFVLATIISALAGTLISAVLSENKSETLEFQIDELLARELVIGEEVDIVSPFSLEGAITVKSYFAVISETKGQGLKVSDIFGTLKEKNLILQFRQDNFSIFPDENDGKFGVYEAPQSYTLQILFEEKIVEEGQTLYKVLDDCYVVVPES